MIAIYIYTHQVVYAKIFSIQIWNEIFPNRKRQNSQVIGSYKWGDI